MSKKVVIDLKIDASDGVKSVGEINDEVKTTLSTLGEMEDASEAVTEALKGTEVGTDEYERLRKELIKVNTEIKNQELAMEALDNEQVASEIKSVVGGLTDMAGGLALVGASGQKMEELVQTFAQVEAASKLVTGSMEAYTSISKLSGTITNRLTAAHAALAAVQKKQGVGSRAAAVGMRILNSVMKANPAFLLVTGITALVGAIVWFMTSTNEAAEASEKLNASLEQQNTLIEANAAARKLYGDTMAEQTSRGISNMQENLDLMRDELDNLKKRKQLTGELSDEEQERYESLRSQIEKTVDSIRDAREEMKLQEVRDATANYNDEVSRVGKNLSLIRTRIDEVRNEDGISDLTEDAVGANKTYKAFKDRVSDLNFEFNALQAGADDMSSEAYVTELGKIIKSAGVLKADMQSVKSELGSGELELWDKVLEQTTKVSDLFQSVGDAAVERRNKVDEYANEFVSGEEDKQEVIKRTSEELDRLEKQQKKNAKEALNRRKAELQQILNRLQREENASTKLASIKNKMADNNIKALELEFGEFRDQIIDEAIKREEGILNQKFIDGKINEKEYIEELKNIRNNYNNYLLDSEKELLATQREYTDMQVAEIERRTKSEEEIALQSAELTNAEIAQMKIEFQMEMDLLDADEIKNVRRREEEKLRIRKEYLEKQKNAINTSAQEQIDVRTAQYTQDITQKGISEAEKKRLTAEYNQDVISINQDAQKKIRKLESNSVDDTALAVQKKAQEINEFASKINGSLQAGMQATSDLFAEMREREAAEREAQYDASSEAFKAQLASREISQKEFDNKMALLEQEKRQREKAEKRKQFQQNKAFQLVNAAMAGAQSVLQALAGFPPPASYVFAGINSGIATAQLALIASKSFKAARGGVVPGAPSKKDSVRAELAPGETVINSTSTQMYPNLLSEINKAGGGVSLAPEQPPETTAARSNKVFASNQNTQPVRAYVVESDISDKQKQAQRIEESASF